MPLLCVDVVDLDETEARLDELMALLDDLEEPEDLDLSLKCVSRCCFMLSARVNFLWQPGYVH